MFSRLIHIVACVSTSFLFMTDYYSIVWINHILCIHSSNGHLGCCHLLATVNNAAMNICVQFFVSILFGYIPRSELLVMWYFYV